MQNILIRSDSSSKIGLGHLMRDLVLAKRFKNSRVTFATQNLEGNANQLIINSPFHLELLDSSDKKELVTLIKDKKIDLLVVDNYEITYKTEKYIKKKTTVKIMVLDDTYEKHHCDILINHNLGASKHRYKGLVPKDCKLLCGIKHTLLRDEFYKQKKISYKKNRFTTIHLSMGGTDSLELNIKILKVLKKYKNIKINLFTTTANKNLKKLKKYIKHKQEIELNINSQKIAKFIKSSDFVISTPSLSANEVLFLNKPLITIMTAKNQKDVHQYLKKKSLTALKKFNAIKLKKALNKMMKNVS